MDNIRKEEQPLLTYTRVMLGDIVCIRLKDTISIQKRLPPQDQFSAIYDYLALRPICIFYSLML